MRSYFGPGIIVLVFLFLLASFGIAREDSSPRNPSDYDIRIIGAPVDDPQGAQQLFTSAVAETFVLAEYDFNHPQSVGDPQGWSGVDLTAQLGTFFHVDDFDDLGGGETGKLVAIDGEQSLWCGKRPDTNEPAVL